MICLVTAIIITCSHLYNSQTYTFDDAILHGVFQVVSIATTTGFTSTDFSSWPTSLPFLLLFFALIGGCAGSTAGGIKSIRVLLILKQGYRELQQLSHQNAIIPIKFGNRMVQDRVVNTVWSFLAVYIISFIILLLMLLSTGINFETSFSAIAASISNLGPGLGDVAAHYGDINNQAKYILCFTMLLGRLEIFTLLILFTPQFWRR